MKFSTIKKTTYLDDVMNLKKSIPSPWQYNTAGPGLLNPKQKSSLSREKKLTFLGQIEKD